MPKRQRKVSRRRLLPILLHTGLILSVVWLLVIILPFGYSVGYRVFDTEEMQASADTVLIIEEGDTAFQIGQKLVELGAIHSAVVFMLQTWIYEVDFVPGSYSLSEMQDVRELLYMLETAYNEAVQDEL